jgi:hypothetical protein
MVAEVGHSYYLNGTVEVTGDTNCAKIGMDNKRFSQEFNWHPQYKMMDSIQSLFEMLYNQNHPTSDSTLNIANQ